MYQKTIKHWQPLDFSTSLTPHIHSISKLYWLHAHNIWHPTISHQRHCCADVPSHHRLSPVPQQLSPNLSLGFTCPIGAPFSETVDVILMQYKSHCIKPQLKILQWLLITFRIKAITLSSAYKPTNDCSWLLPPFLPLCLHTLYSSFPVLLVLPGTSPASGPLHLPFFHPKTLFPIIFTWLAPHFRSFSRVTSHSTKRPSRTSQAKQKPSRSTL